MRRARQPESISAGRLKVCMWATYARLCEKPASSAALLLHIKGSVTVCTEATCMLQEQDTESAPQQMKVASAESATKEGSVPTAGAWDSVQVPPQRMECNQFLFRNTTQRRLKMQTASTCRRSLLKSRAVLPSAG